MAMMFDVTPGNSDALMRVYKNELHLNRAAVRLLQIKEGEHRIRMTYDADELTCGRTRIYISRCGAATPKAFDPKFVGGTVRLYSSELCRSLADKLQGYGTYRICHEVTKAIGDDTYYEVFFKRY